MDQIKVSCIGRQILYRATRKAQQQTESLSYCFEQLIWDDEFSGNNLNFCFYLQAKLISKKEL